MSFIDTLGSIVKGAGRFFTTNSIGASLAKSALLGFALSRVAKSIKKQQEEQKDTGAQIQVNPSTDNSVPVIYGDAYTNGTITDAYMSGDNKTMWVCLTLSEMTGQKIDGTDSAISFQEVYYNGLRLRFQEDGVTVGTAFDDEGNSTNTFSGLIKIYPYSGSSTDPVSFATEIAGNTANAYDVFPTWTSSNAMNDLVFAIVRITYNKTNKVTSVNNFRFKISNTMTQPGDVLFDYMNNSRYGAGIPAAEIYKS